MFVDCASFETTIPNCSFMSVFKEIAFLIDLPASRNISTVKKTTASIPLICCSTSNIRPMISGIISGRVKMTLCNFCSTVSLSAGFSRSEAATALSSADNNSVDGNSNFNHLTDWSASWNRFLLRSQTGDSGKANITTPTENAIALLHQANVSHWATLPTMYANKIPTDIIIVGNDPKMPRIAGSQLSPIWKVIRFYCYVSSNVELRQTPIKRNFVFFIT